MDLVDDIMKDINRVCSEKNSTGDEQERAMYERELQELQAVVVEIIEDYNSNKEKRE